MELPIGLKIIIAGYGLFALWGIGWLAWNWITREE
jgi:hypothetical protein